MHNLLVLENGFSPFQAEELRTLSHVGFIRGFDLKDHGNERPKINIKTDAGELIRLPLLLLITDKRQVGGFEKSDRVISRGSRDLDFMCAIYVPRSIPFICEPSLLTIGPHTHAPELCAPLRIREYPFAEEIVAGLLRADLLQLRQDRFLVEIDPTGFDFGMFFHSLILTQRAALLQWSSSPART